MTKLLVVEDDEENQFILHEMLEAQGYVVESALDGESALEKLKGDVLPDVILLDMSMPKMDGWDFLRRKEQDQRLRSIPVVLLTASPPQKVRVQEMANVILIIDKPFHPEALIRVLRLLRKSDPPPSF